MFAAEISYHFARKIFLPTFTRVLNKCDFTKYAKMNKKPILTDKHKKIRIETVVKWIRDWVNY